MAARLCWLAVIHMSSDSIRLLALSASQLCVLGLLAAAFT